MHDDDEGLARDLPRLMGRRGVLASILGLGVVGLAIAQGRAEGNRFGTAADGSTCLANPTETGGPYPADGSNSRAGQVVNALAEEGILRDDLRASFGPLQGTADGIPLELEIRLLAVDGCKPLAGHAIYLWHADTQGRYSLYDLPDQNFLRGVVVTDAEGVARVTTILPGCYDGRWPHIHFEVFASAAEILGRPLLTSQMALPEAACRAAYGDARYPDSLRNLDRVTLERDNVFGDNTAEQIAQQTLTMTAKGAAYAATVSVGI